MLETQVPQASDEVPPLIGNGRRLLRIQSTGHCDGRTSDGLDSLEGAP